MPPVQRNQELELIIEDIAAGGKGIARLDNFILFVDGKTVPGQRLLGRVTRVKPNYAEVRILRLLQPSPIEIKAPCPYFSHCGGCRHQNIPYHEQLNYLQQQVKDLYQHIGAISVLPMQPILPAEKIWRYRNKMEFAFSNRRWSVGADDATKPKIFALGLRIPDNYYSAIDIADCLIAPEESAIILDTVRQFAIKQQLEPYDTKAHRGVLRHLVVRKGIFTNEVMVNLVTTLDQPEIFLPLADELTRQMSNLKSLVNTISRNVSGTTQGEKLHVLYGRGFIYDKIGDLVFKISPMSFFQTNTPMAHRLYEIVHQYAEPLSNAVVWDLYCGAGSIALYLARTALSVIGIEIVPEAVHDAQENAVLNGITNVQFIQANLDSLFQPNSPLKNRLPAPDIVIVDPPRGGLHPKLIEYLLILKPAKIIYVSCNPATQVRDIQAITTAGYYEIAAIQPIDLFPHTPHIEVVTKLIHH